jgi:hypothetical protein
MAGRSADFSIKTGRRVLGEGVSIFGYLIKKARVAESRSRNEQVKKRIGKG